MKKVLIAAGVSLIAFAAVAGAAGLTLSGNLTVGSTGSDVVSLQSWLIANGFNIPALASGAAAKGYFGAQTKAAVVAYQKANGIPSTGFVGPLTRGKLSGSAVVSPVTPVTPVTPVSMNGTDGSLSVSDSSFVSSGQSLKKGDTKDVVAVRLQATAGPVTVTRLDVHFSYRPWLYFSQVTLKDNTGRVLATKPIMSAADATEITVASDYLVRFEGLNYVVTPGVNPDLAVGVTVLAATDKITDGMSVNAGIPTGAIRTINGIGISDSVGGAAFPASSGAGERAFTLTSTGSKADIATRISPASAPTTRSQVISSTVTTSGVVLGVYSVKATNNSATLQSVNFTIQTNPSGTPYANLFSNVRLLDGSASYGSVLSSGTATFTNLNIALAQDAWKDLTLVADIAATTSDVTASSTLVASTISAVDTNYNTATISGSNQTAANVLMTINSMSISNTSAAVTQSLTDVANGPVTRYSVAYTFTLTNNSNNSLYVSATLPTFLGTTTSPTNASSTMTLLEPVTPVSGDVTGTAYIIPSGGGSRTFTIDGIIKKSSNSSSAESMSISTINYGTTSAGTGSTITAGLEKLYKATNF